MLSTLLLNPRHASSMDPASLFHLLARLGFGACRRLVIEHIVASGAELELQLLAITRMLQEGAKMAHFGVGRLVDPDQCDLLGQ